MPAFLDYTGQRFGRLVAQRYDDMRRREPNGRHVFAWLCVCDCGETTHVLSGNLRSGNTVSCGCFRKEVTSAASRKHGRSAGGPRPSPEYEIWKGMLSRCTNPNHKSFHNYGGRGITVSPLWAGDFEAFYTHIGPRPSPELTVERIDNDGNYEPGNVKWATRKEQRQNQRRVSECRPTT